MNQLLLLVALIGTPWIPPQMASGDKLYGTSQTVNPYSAHGISLELSKLTGVGGPLDFWVYGKQKWLDRLHVEIPATDKSAQRILVSFNEPFLFDQVLVRGMDKLAPWDGQTLTFTGAVYSTVPEPSALMLAIIGACACAFVYRNIRKAVENE